MAGELLLDTGGLVSLLDSRQRHHRSVLEYFQEWTGRVVSTEAVLTESTHLLGRVPRGPQTCIEFFLRGGAVLVPSSGTSLLRAKRLIDQYAGLPMDYADATLVVLAEELDASLILTTDRRDFQTYRIGGSKAFEIVPG